MYPVGVLSEIFTLVVLIWLSVLTYLIWKEKRYLGELFPKDSKGDIRVKFEEVLTVLAETQRRDQILNRNIRQIAKDGLNHIQKIAVLRYNPYQDTGGDQSFSIAMLDGIGSGFILTSLHTRAGTRVYTKNIVEGKCDLKLSMEEEEVVEKAFLESSDESN